MAKHKIRPLPIADRRFVRSAIGSGVALEDYEAIRRNSKGQAPLLGSGVTLRLTFLSGLILLSSLMLGYAAGNDKLKPTLSETHHPEMGSCLKAIFPKGEYPGVSMLRFVSRDWSASDSLKFDVYNEYEEVIKFGILIKDNLGDAYPDRYDGYFAFKPGMNNFELNITGLKTNNKKRLLKMDKIKQFEIFLFKPNKEFTLYFDNIRLEKEKSVVFENLYRFDFGTEDSEVWPGFIKVTDKTEYTKEKGYGWNAAQGLNADDRQYPDPLFRDWVRGSGPFNVDLPSGEYVVYTMLEDPGFWEYYQNYEEREIYAEDMPVFEEYMDSSRFFNEYYFKHLNREDLPGDDAWENYVNVRFKPKVFKVKVEDGQLNLRFLPSEGYACTLSALIIYPSEYEDKGAEYIEEINKKREKYFTTQFIESIPKTQPLSFTLTEEDKKRGYILFIKNYLERVYPHAVPRKEEIKEEIRIFAARGEYEPVSISIYPLKDLGICELSTEDLISEDGSKIASENIDIRVTQYKLKLKGKKVYEVRGELLREQSKVIIENGITRQFWITFKIPDGTLAGDYIGNLHFKPSKGEEQIVTLKVKVLPFKLAEPDIALGMFYFSPAYLKWYKDTQRLYWAEVEKHLWDLKEHNMNSLAIDLSPRIQKVYDEGKVELDFGELDRFIEVYKRSGFTKPIVGYGMSNLIEQAEGMSKGDEEKFSTILQNTYKAIKDHVESIYGPEIIFCLADEISNVEGKGIEYGVKVAKIAKNVNGIKITAMLNSAKDEAIFPYLDIATINNGMKINKSLIDKIKNDGSQLWFYNIGGDRFSFGYYLAKTGAKGRLQWNYQLPAVDPYFDLDGRESDYCASYPSMDGPINSVWFEWIREGIDDYRYISMLSNLIEKGKSSGNPSVIEQAKKAEEIMNGILDDISIELKKNHWDWDEYDKKRREIAEEIVKLI